MLFPLLCLFWGSSASLLSRVLEREEERNVGFVLVKYFELFDILSVSSWSLISSCLGIFSWVTVCSNFEEGEEVQDKA